LPWGWLLALYNVGVLIYVIYGVEVGRGFAGILFDIEMRLFGAASENMTILVGFLVLAVPSWVVALSLLPGRPAPDGEETAPWSPGKRWLVLVGLSLALGALPGVWYVVEAHNEQEELAQPVYDLDLARSVALPARDARFVVVHGYRILAGSYAFSKALQGGGLKQTTTYIPLVEPTWRPGAPVTYVVDSEWNPNYFPATIAGRIERNDLPRFVRSGFARERVELAAPYYVIRPARIEAGRVRSTGREFRHLAWIAIGLTLVVLLPGAGIVYLRNAR
jgi:hypothetical protein